jgi:nicotinate dehydrogenase subunit A
MTINQASGKKITTLEGLSHGDTLHPVQAAFVTEQAAQCGYCTNGMVMNAVALLTHQPKPTQDDVKQALVNNLCRCGTHDRIIRAVMRASGKVLP